MDIFDEMAKKWPSEIISRTEIKKFTGGGISPKTLANADSEGEGPRGRFVLGRKICYPTKEVVKWLRSKKKSMYITKRATRLLKN